MIPGDSLIAKMTELRTELCEVLNNCGLVTVSLILLSYCQIQKAFTQGYGQGFDAAFTKKRNEKGCRSLGNTQTSSVGLSRHMVSAPFWNHRSIHWKCLEII